MLNRRNFLAAAAALAQAQAPGRRYDLLIRNGDVRDPRRGFRVRADVAILDGKVAAIDTHIPSDRARDVIDARGLYVTPGLVDLHTHCYHGGTGLGVEADRIGARSGVTTWVDAGSFGYDTFTGFKEFIVERSQARVFGYVYLYPGSRNLDIDPVKYVRGVMRQTGEVVSTDIYNLNINGPVYDMPTTMSKLLYLGLSFDDALLRSTANPAEVVGRLDGLGTLRVGGPADIALLAIEEGEFYLVDSQKNAVTAKQRIVSRLTICRGRRLLAPL